MSQHPHTAQTTTPAKTRHYVAVLSTALLKGAWADSVVGKDYKGRDMDWAELLRKWEKHGGNNPDLIHHLREISLLYLSHTSPSASGYITIPQPYGTSTASDDTGRSGGTVGTTGTTTSAAGTATSDGSFVHVHHPELSGEASLPTSPTRVNRPEASSAPITPSKPSGLAQSQALAQGAGTPSSLRRLASSTAPASPAQAAKERAAYLHSTSTDLDADPSDSESDDAEAWKVGTAWWKGVPLDRREEVSDGIRGLEALVMKGKLNAAEREAAKLCWAYHLHAVGQHEAAVRLYDEVDWSADREKGMVPGDASVLARARGRCLQAMSIELIDPSDPLALEYYLSSISFALSLISIPTPSYLSDLPGVGGSTAGGTAPQSRRGTVSSMSTHSRMPTSASVTGTGSISASTSASSPLSAPLASSSSIPFEPLREVHRWLNTALVRASILSARQSGSEALPQTLRVLRTYHAISAVYPPTWRPKERQRMLRMYMRALKVGRAGEWEKPGNVGAYLLPGVIPPSPLDAGSAGSAGLATVTAKSIWKAEIVSALRQARDLLSTTTTFPRSGARNTAVLAFVDDTVALALLADDASLPDSPESNEASVVREAVDTLYWAQTITFNSQAILRHLVTLLAKQGVWDEARRAFEAYVRLVRKDREANGPEAAVMEGGDDAEGDGNRSEAGVDGADGGTAASASYLEDDETFARTLLLGARIIGRELGEPLDALEYVQEAAALHDKAASDDVAKGSGMGRGLGKDVKAAVERLWGVLEGRLAAEGTMPYERRQEVFSSSIAHLSQSGALSPSSLTSYHLAHLYALTSQLELATASIRACLESEDVADEPSPAEGGAEQAGPESGADIQHAPEGIAAWHLLALLRTADRDWDGALRACEAGIGAWEDGEEAWEAVERALPSATASAQVQSAGPSRKGSAAPSVAASTAKGRAAPGVASKDYGITASFSTLALNDGERQPRQGEERRFSLSSAPERDWEALLTDEGHLAFPSTFSSSSALSSVSAASSPEQIRRERLADIIALRQTAIVIAEKRDGAEVALEQQRELFGFFKARSVPSLSVSYGQAKRQRSGTGGTAVSDMYARGTRSKSGSVASVGAPASSALGLVGAPPATAQGDRLRGMTPMNPEHHRAEGGEVETLRESGQGHAGAQSAPSLTVTGLDDDATAQDQRPASTHDTITASPVSTLRAAEGTLGGEEGTLAAGASTATATATNPGTAALDQRPLAPILLGAPIGSTLAGSAPGSGSTSTEETNKNTNQATTVDLADSPSGGQLHVSPRSVPAGLPHSASTAENMSASAHPAPSAPTAGQQGLGVPMAVPLITESGASTPMSSARDSDSGPGTATGTRTTNSPPGSVRFEHVGAGSDTLASTSTSPTKGKGAFGKLHVPLLKGHGHGPGHGHGLQGGKQRAGTAPGQGQGQGMLGVGQVRGLESPSAPDLAMTRNNRITSQSSIALSTTSQAPSIFKRMRHPYATSTYAQSTTSRRLRAGKSKRQASGAASIAGISAPNSAIDVSGGNGSSRRQSSPLASPPAPASGLAGPRHGRTPAELRVLSDLWLASAATYRRLGELGQARGAIQEAETYDPEDPAVWVQLALCELAEAEDAIEMQREEAGTGATSSGANADGAGRFDRAIATLTKALALQADYLPALVHLAKTYLVKAVSQSQAQLFAAAGAGTGSATSNGDAAAPGQQRQQQQRAAAEGDVALCEALLNGALEGVAWGCTEAYALRAECRRLRGDEVGEREDLVRALEGEVGRGIRGWEVVRDWF